MSPRASWLFTLVKIRELKGKRLDTFHSVVIKLLCILQRGQPDFATAISFLCTRMNHPDVEYCKKLKRLLCFTNMTIDKNRIIGEN